MSYWVKKRDTWFPYYAPSDGGIVAFVNNGDPPPTYIPYPGSAPVLVYPHLGPDTILNDVWVTACLPPELPNSIYLAHIVGVMIITYGEADLSHTAEMQVTFRRPLYPPLHGSNYDYVAQVCEARSGGVRSPLAVEVAIEDGKFQYRWTRATPKSVAGISYGIKLYVTSARDEVI